MAVPAIKVAEDCATRRGGSFVVDRDPVDSSTLETVGYQDGVLEIEFKNGRVYQYFDVPEWVVDGLTRAPSKGKFFTEQIRGHFRYARI
jgi:hypothetical protein